MGLCVGLGGSAARWAGGWLAAWRANTVHAGVPRRDGAAALHACQALLSSIIVASSASVLQASGPSPLCRRAGYTFPYLFDGSQDVARAYKAACTPEFYRERAFAALSAACTMLACAMCPVVVRCCALRRLEEGMACWGAPVVAGLLSTLAPSHRRAPARTSLAPHTRLASSLRRLSGPCVPRPVR